MAKQGLVRIPFYPQLNCLTAIDEQAPLVMSALLFWMTRSKEPSYCPARHNYQMALHLGINIQIFNQCLEKLQATGIFNEHIVQIPPKEVTADSKVRIEKYLDLNFNALQALLKEHGFSVSLKLLKHASDDSFDCYDVIEEKFLPTTQCLLGYLSAQDYEQAALIASTIGVYINEFDEEFALKAIAPGWKLLLAVPMNSTWQEYAQELTVRFLRAGERAIDFSFTDGNFFFPDYSEIKSKLHLVKHFGNKVESRIMAATMMLALAAHFSDKLTFVSELSVKELEPAFIKLKAIYPDLDLSLALQEDYYSSRRLSKDESALEHQRFAQLLASLNTKLQFLGSIM